MVNPYQNNFYNPQPTYPQQFYSPYMQQQRYQQQGQTVWNHIRLQRNNRNLTKKVMSA